LALISKARAAPSLPRNDSTPSMVAGTTVAAAFFSTISRPSVRRLVRGSAAWSISDGSFGKNIPVGSRNPARAPSGTSRR